MNNRVCQTNAVARIKGNYLRPRPLVVLGSAIVLTGAVALGHWAVSGRSSGMAAAQEQAVRTSIDSYLEQNRWRGILAAQYPKQGVRWFCADQVVEMDQDEEELKVGLLVLCREFTAVDGELVIGSGSRGPQLATVTSPPRSLEVLRVESPPDGSGYGSWVSAHFSWAGAKKLDRTQASSSQELEDATNTKARNAFGLPADAPVRGPS
jgi:hypothetical protein